MTEKLKECCHTNKKNTSIIVLKGFITMADPAKRYGICPVCGHRFEFIKKTNGKEEILDVDDRRDEGETE